ncbi:MAG: YegS/Rv2252/BmrU family lipid kinase [Oscillospiraceae bacterium]|nr:YegS/Rv2252/BmrU family lipid kinase [Oscillospiraceae bacterium]
MRHVFIINPTAGKKDCTARLMAMAKNMEATHGVNVECILTRRPGHATETARTIAQTGENVRFYVCGGDGTINEVANGIAGIATAAMTCIPVGTGNDFLKNFGDKAELFADAENLWGGPQFALDTIDCNGRLALTIACSGFDAQVAEDVHTYGKSPMLGGQGSYIASLAVNFLVRGLDHRWTVTVDGRAVSGSFALAAVCNGRHYGGGFTPIPQARMDDGLMNVLLMDKISRAAFLRFVGNYKNGEHEKFQQYAQVSTAREVIIESRGGEDIITCLDGEIVRNKRVVMRLSDKKVNVFGPAGCDPNATCRA